jgi:hypothetical protein
MPLPVYATSEFTRPARRLGVDDDKLCEAAERAERGLIDADLRAGLIKQRVARKGQGRRGGFRVLAAFRRGHRCVFLYPFAKNERDNIEDDELAHWHTVARAYLQLGHDQLEEQLAADELREVPCDD